MIIIVDDTFIDRHKFNDVSYLEEPKYTDVCSVHSIIKTTDLSSLMNSLSNCQFFCNHKTLQLYTPQGVPLNIGDNSKYRESLINEVSRLKIKRVEFSRQLETNYDANKIDKDLFYNNLKPFLDYFIDTNIIESKIIFFGESFREKERMLLIQKMMMQIRIANLEDYKNNLVIKQGLGVLYPQESIEKIIDGWINRKLSKNEIVLDINNQIK